jgi:pyrroline-5-carboxylate reductase
MSIRVILVGCGNMGYAMLSGWLASGRLEAGKVGVVEPNDTLRLRADELGVHAHEAVEALIDARPELVIFAVKPQVMGAVVPAYRHLADGGTTFLSVAAGTGIATLEGILGAATPIIRCMPNTPASIGRGMMVTVANDRVSDATKDFVTGLLSASGKVAEIDDEALMDAVTAVSGSGPAYVFHFIECLTKAGETAGLPTDIAKLLAMQTVYGAGCLAAESAEEPAELRRQVTSPNGTTAAALAVFMDEGRLEKLVGKAVEAARARSVELGKA